MQPQEILPSPEKKQALQHAENMESSDEEQGAKQVEQKSQASHAGSGLMTASAVDDAQSHLKGIATNDDDATDDDNDDHKDMPSVAEDVDLIEKEWVKKAKDIVEATYGDPYKQNKEINKIKSAYIKKRYNKELKSQI